MRVCVCVSCTDFVTRRSEQGTSVAKNVEPGLGGLEAENQYDYQRGMEIGFIFELDCGLTWKMTWWRLFLGGSY